MRFLIVAMACIVALSGTTARSKFGESLAIYNKSDTSIRYSIVRDSPKYAKVACLEVGQEYHDRFILGAPDQVTIDFYGHKYPHCMDGIVYFKTEKFSGSRTEYSANGTASATSYNYSVAVSH
ncbi:MAG: hypothetical protein JO024_01915 [Candidatus Eremiobacteraeota bacterium]|nr:hypothetical protein [Candidatus Eremiobacteraeota bacterium]